MRVNLVDKPAGCKYHIDDSPTLPAYGLKLWLMGVRVGGETRRPPVFGKEKGLAADLCARRVAGAEYKLPY